MLWRVVFAGWIVLGTQAFAPVRIQWDGTGTKKITLVAEGFPNTATATPLKLMIGDQSDGAFSKPLPTFTAKFDKTIRWNNWCIEVGGTKIGDEVRLNRCNGGQNQKFNWLPLGRERKNKIQLEDTTMCLDFVAKEGDANGAPIALQECEAQAEGSWIFERHHPLPEQVPSMQHVLRTFMALIALGAFSLGALLWKWQKHASNATSHGSLSTDQGGVALITRKQALDKPNLDVNCQQIVPAVLTINPSDEEEASSEEPPFLRGQGSDGLLVASRRVALAAAFAAAPVVAYDAMPVASGDLQKAERLRKEREAVQLKNKQEAKPYLKKFVDANDSDSFVKACDDFSLWLIGKGVVPDGLKAPAIRDTIQSAYSTRPQKVYKCKSNRDGVCYTRGQDVEDAYKSVLSVLKKYTRSPGKGALQADGVSSANTGAF